MATDMTLATVLVTDKAGSPQALSPVEFSVNSRKISWPGCITNALGKVVLTWPAEPSSCVCVYRIGNPAHSGQLTLPQGKLHNIRIVLDERRPESKTRERTFRLVERKTMVTDARLPDMHVGPQQSSVTYYESGGKRVPSSRALRALKIDERRGQIDGAFIEDDGEPFAVAATRWERNHCLPIGETKLVPVVNGNGVLVAWHHSLVSPDHLFSVIPPLFYELFPDLFPRDDMEVPPAALIVYDPKGKASVGLHKLSKTSIGFFPGGDGGVKFSVLFGIHGNVLALQVSSNGRGGRGDPLWDKVSLVFSLGQLLRGLVVGLTRWGLKTLARRAAAKAIDDPIVNAIDDAAALTSVGSRLTVEEGERVAARLVKASDWLRELKRIRGIKEMDKQYRAIAKFIDDYKRATGIHLDVLPRSLAKERRLGVLPEHLAARKYGNEIEPNWGTYAEKEAKIYMHEDVWTKNNVEGFEIDVMTEIGHEVGATEICRLMKRSKNSIPSAGPFGLTHLIDVLLK